MSQTNSKYPHIHLSPASQSQLAALLLRISLGIIMLAHSLYLKLIVFTLPGTAKFFASIGLPESLAYIVFAIETLAGIALIIGYQARIAALSLIPVLLGATWAHINNGWLFTNTGGGWEYPLLLTILAIVLLLNSSSLKQEHSL